MAEQLHNSLLALNMLVTSGTRQRRFDVLKPLGDDFSSYATLTKGLSAEREVLFDDHTESEIKKEIKEAEKKKSNSSHSSKYSYNSSRSSFTPQSSHSKNSNPPRSQFNTFAGGNKKTFQKKQNYNTQGFSGGAKWKK